MEEKNVLESPGNSAFRSFLWVLQMAIQFTTTFAVRKHQALFGFPTDSGLRRLLPGVQESFGAEEVLYPAVLNKPQFSSSTTQIFFNVATYPCAAHPLRCAGSKMILTVFQG